jgi:hypothetical protein
LLLCRYFGLQRKGQTCYKQKTIDSNNDEGNMESSFVLNNVIALQIITQQSISMKLRNKSIIFTGLVIILTFGAVAYFIGDKMAITARKMSVDLALSKAQNSFLIVQTEIENRCRQAELFAEAVDEFAFGREFATIKGILESDLRGSPEISARWFITIDMRNRFQKKYRMNGIVLEKLNDSIFVKSTSVIHENILLNQVKNLRGTVLSQPYKNDQGKEIISILAPVIVNSYFKGIIGFDIDLKKFQQIFYDVKSLGRAYVSIISKNGICITHPDENLIGKQVGNNLDSSFVQLALQTGVKQQKEVHSEFLNLPVMRVYKPIRIAHGNDYWLITVSVPLFNVEEAVQEVRNSTALIGIALALLLMVFLYYSQRRWLSEFQGRQKAETKHRDILNKLSSILESTDQIRIFSVDKKYRYTSFNSVYKKDALVNEGMKVEVGISALNTYHHDFGELMKSHFDRALSGEHFLTEYERNNRHYQQVFNAIFDENDKVIGFSSFRFDISETVELRKRANLEEEEKLKAQLKNIKNQINPHFLFNSLNSLYALVETEPNLARKFILKLSKVYRYLLDQNNSSLVDLKQELDFMKHYIFLQKIRFGDNLSLEYDIPEEYMAYKLPSVSLQSLVENAIKHNIVTTEKPLVISMKIENGRLLVENNYQLRSDFASNSGTGLKTLNALYAFLGEEQAEYGVEGEKFVVRLPLL